jgi:transposase
VPQIIADYKQVFLLPPCIEDWVGPDHPARFIRDFVDSMSLKELGFRVPDSETGRPAYSADLLLKAWLYGYFSRIRSSRKLEKGCMENMGLIWLTAMHGPDHNTLWRFWRDNRKVFKRVFKQSVQVAVKAELIGMAVHAVDGTKIVAGASREKFKNQDQLERMLENLDKYVADAGYFASGQIALAEEKEYEVLVAKSSGEIAAEKGAEWDPYHASRFVYDQDQDVCICPQGAVLRFLQKKVTGKNDNEVRRYRCRDYATCPERWKCSKSKNGRLIDINVHREALERHRKKRRLPENKKLLRARKVIIEPVFAWIKTHLDFRRWSVSGLCNVRGQWSLICATINLKKLYRHWLTGGLVFSGS